MMSQAQSFPFRGDGSPAQSFPLARTPGGRASASPRGILVSKERCAQLHSFHTMGRGSTASSLNHPASPPPVWPAVLVSFLHNVSMGAALMVWIDVCKAAFPAGSVDADGLELSTTAPQTFYGRLLAVNAICELVTSQAVGVLSDRYGRRALQISAQTGQLIDYAAAGLCLPSLGYLGQIPPHMIMPVLFATRGLAGFMGNFRVSLQAYASDISSAEECPLNVAYVGAAIVVGMCVGSGMVAAIDIMDVSYRACYFSSIVCNASIIIVVVFKWRDVAPRKEFSPAELNPLAGMPLLMKSPTMRTYSVLIFLSSFALNIYTSTLAFYCEKFLDMKKTTFTVLGAEWALLSALFLGIVQDVLVRKLGEIRTLVLSFLTMTLFYLGFSLLTEETWWVSYVIMGLFSFSCMSYPLSVGLATREVAPDEQGALQGAVSVLETSGKILAPLIASDVLIPMFAAEGEFHGAVYFFAACVVMPGIFFAGSLAWHTSKFVGPADSTNLVELEIS